MSDQGDFRGSREEKRKEETVMLSAGQLGEMMAAAKGEPASEPSTGQPVVSVAPAAQTEAGSKTTMIIAAAAVAAVVVLLVLYMATR